MRIIDLPDSWSGRALIVAEAGDAESWLTAEELAVAGSFPRARRRSEWISSRIAARVLRQHGAAGAHVSFSHSGPYGAAAVDSQPVGLDVEVLRPISENAAHLFLTDEEIAVMRRCAIAHRLLHFWCAKEALWKQRGGSVPTLRRVPLLFEREGSDGLRFRGVETYARADLIAALTLPTS